MWAIMAAVRSDAGAGPREEARFGGIQERTGSGILVEGEGHGPHAYNEILLAWLPDPGTRPVPFTGGTGSFFFRRYSLSCEILL